MKKGMIIVVVFFLTWILNSGSISDAESRRELRDSYFPEAVKVWRGQYSPGDLEKWEKRVKKEKDR